MDPPLDPFFLDPLSAGLSNWTLADELAQATPNTCLGHIDNFPARSPRLDKSKNDKKQIFLHTFNPNNNASSSGTQG